MATIFLKRSAQKSTHCVVGIVKAKERERIEELAVFEAEPYVWVTS